MRSRKRAGEPIDRGREGETLERVGDLLVAQPDRGYRYGLDPFLLVSFVEHPRDPKGGRLVDIGTGCGIITLLLARRFSTARIWGVEVQHTLARIAGENVHRNGLEDRCIIMEGDARRIGDLLPMGEFDGVVANPPFRPPGSGRVCSEPQRALARQELALSFPELCRAASALLRHGGTFDCVHLPERLPELFLSLSRAGLEPKRLRLVHSFAGSSPEIALLSARRGGRPGLTVEAPLVIYEKPGIYTAETAGIFPQSDSPCPSISS